jgi:tryptophan synthase alpha subunit
MKKGLSVKDRLYPEAHELVRACKLRGLAMSFYGHRKTKSARFKEIIENSSVTYSR